MLLSGDGRWVAAATEAAAAAGMTLEVTARAEEVLVALSGPHAPCRLLLDPGTAGSSALAIVEMTCGEVDSGVDVLMLGGGGGALPDVQVVPAPDPAALAAALARPDPFRFEWSGQPPLEVPQLVRMMEAGHLQVRFQPIVGVRDRSLVALEVLARLHRTTCAILPPHRFIPQLEQAGFGAELLRHVAEAAFSVNDALCGARLALNLPLNVLHDRNTVDMLETLRRKADVPAFRILLELTETEVVENVAGLDPVIQHWRDAGYAMVIDDAGPGVPRHRDMFRLPFDWVKLDKSVVHGALGSHGARQYMADMVASAHRARLSVIAEGVETQEAWDLLRDLGVDCGQGYMVARPLPADVVAVWLRAWQAGAPQFPS